MSMGKIPVLEDAEPVGPAEDEAVTRLKAGNIATAIGVEAQLERLARTVKMLVFIVCVCVCVCGCYHNLCAQVEICLYVLLQFLWWNNGNCLQLYLSRMMIQVSFQYNSFELTTSRHILIKKHASKFTSSCIGKGKRSIGAAGLNP